ncbi:RNA polymerase sigma-70 factor [Flexithrix dorotheae]|uniref:RNA polymerase sigma-70 factor n=1 Tax=Flexithrix dorotheae TaxID=70993 RepID=UPI00035D3990|nr:RNA polymerase sigma-70 factor [Flexithrix dorotheae]
MSSKISIKKLAGRLQKGELSAFGEIYELYKDKLYGFSFKMLASEDLSKDIVQETFIKLWENRHKIDENKSLNAYLYTISKNLIKEQQRNYSKSYEMSSKILEDEQASLSSLDVLDSFNYLEIKEMEKKVVNVLTPQQKEVYMLSRYNHLSNQEIANNLGISINSVKTHLRLALKTLKLHIAPITDLLLLVMAILIAG